MILQSLEDFLRRCPRLGGISGGFIRGLDTVVKGVGGCGMGPMRLMGRMGEKGS